jgi:hypothetical protein
MTGSDDGRLKPTMYLGRKMPNIGPRGQRRRLGLGGVALAIGVLAAVLLIGADAPRALRAVLFVPFYSAALGFFQAKDKT